MNYTRNICIITQEFPEETNFGGIAIFYKNLVNELLAKKFKVSVITRSKSLLNGHKITPSLSVYRIGFPFFVKYFTGRFFDKILFSLFAYFFFLKLNKKENFNLIESTETYFESLFLSFDKNYFQKIIIQCHGSNNINVIPKGLFSILHSLDFKLCLLIERVLLKRSHTLIAPSKSVLNILLKNGVDLNRIKLLNHGINTDKFIPNKNKKKSNKLKMLFVGKIQFMKGSDFLWLLTKEINKLENISLNLVGDIHPNEKNNLKENLKKYPKTLKYTGKVKSEEMINIYQNHDILIHPSRSEQFGLVYAEAMASGLIVLAGKNGGSTEIIKNNIDGFIFDPNKDLKKVVDLIIKIRKNKSSYSNFVKKSRKAIIDNFSNSSVINQRISLYKNI